MITPQEGRTIRAEIPRPGHYANGTLGVLYQAWDWMSALLEADDIRPWLSEENRARALRIIDNMRRIDREAK